MAGDAGTPCHGHATGWSMAYRSATIASGSPATAPSVPLADTQNQIWIERFHQTLKRWLGRQPAARTLIELQAQLDAFRLAYDEERPHRAVGRVTLGEAYRATPKAILPDAVPQVTSGFATTSLTARARSPCAEQAGCITSGPAPPTLVGASSPSSTSTRSPSSPSTRARSSPRIASSPSGPTGATNDETPADGRGLERHRWHQGWSIGCRRCPDSCVSCVATHDNGVPGRTRTCDRPLRRRLLCPLSYGDAVSCSVYARVSRLDRPRSPVVSSHPVYDIRSVASQCRSASTARGRSRAPRSVSRCVLRSGAMTSACPREQPQGCGQVACARRDNAPQRRITAARRPPSPHPDAPTSRGGGGGERCARYAQPR